MKSLLMRTITVVALSMGLAAITFATDGPALTFLGRASVKIVTATGFVIYIDPYAGSDYAAKADLVLVTHGHSDHNQVAKLERNADCVVAAPSGAIRYSGAMKTVKVGEVTRVAAPVCGLPLFCDLGAECGNALKQCIYLCRRAHVVRKSKAAKSRAFGRKTCIGG